MPKTISVIIPCLNEQANIEKTLHALQSIRDSGHEIILCDGGSTDKTVVLAKKLVDRVIKSPAGRSLQLNTGANIASGDVLCFLHADTIAPENIVKYILASLESSGVKWGFFKITLSGSQFVFRIIEWFINACSRLSRIATGDQGLFISRDLFIQTEGFHNMPLMEDIEFTARIKKWKSVFISEVTLTTSSRRWEKHGIIKTVLLMWKLRLLYFFGADPHRLKKKYINHAKP